MERIKLSKSEKTVLRFVANGVAGWPADFPRAVYNYAVRSLCDKKFLRGCFVEGGDVEDACLTSYGRRYLAVYPDLRSPVEWSVIATIASIIAAITSFIALFVACSKF